VRVQHYKAGFEAAEVMIEMIEKPGASATHVTLPVEMIVRNSTKRSAVTAKQKETAGEEA
jgi:DNA-binding LacI/PurR family transcriptional regulator